MCPNEKSITLQEDERNICGGGGTDEDQIAKKTERPYMIEKGKTIWVCLATKKNESVAKQTIKTIFELSDYFFDEKICLIVLDKTPISTLKEWLFRQFPHRKFIYQDHERIQKRDLANLNLYEALEYDLATDSVQRARIQLMLTCKDFMDLLKESIIWQIDDDILFEEPCYFEGKLRLKQGRNFFSEIREYHARYPYVDAAIGNYTGTPPLPILLYSEKQIWDILKQSEPIEIGKVPAGDTENYHDLYPSLGGETIQKNSKDDFLGSFESLLRGQPITRPLLSTDHLKRNSPPTSSFLRGGNFAIFNPEVAVKYPHITLQFDNLIGRRSDMIHAWMLSKSGFNICGMDISLYHNRRFSIIDQEKISQEYLSDALGAIAFRYLDSPQMARDRYYSHKDHLCRLENLATLVFTKHPSRLTGDFLQMIKSTLARYLNWDWDDLKASLVKFKEKVLMLLDSNWAIQQEYS